MLSALAEYQLYIFIACGIIIPALCYAIYLQWQTFNEMKIDKERKREEILAGQKKRQQGLRESIEIISMATIQEQCEISEACLRIANLLPLYDHIDHTEEQWKPLFAMYEEIRELKTLEARKDLRASERFSEDKRRFASEEKFQKEILTICEELYRLTRTDKASSQELH